MVAHKNKNVGSTLDSFLAQEGILEHTELVAIKRIIVDELRALLKRESMTQTDLARKMNTSKAAINRLLDPNNPSLTLQTLIKATRSLGKNISINIH